MVEISKNAQAYEQVLLFFVQKNNGLIYGAKTMMAREVGVSRQNCDNWQGKGIPRKYVHKIAEITGMEPSDILPEPY